MLELNITIKKGTAKLLFAVCILTFVLGLSAIILNVPIKPKEVIAQQQFDSKIIATIPPIQNNLTSTSIGNSILFSMGSEKMNVTVSSGILNELEVPIPNNIVSRINEISGQKQKFSYNFSFTLISSMTLGLKYIVNSSTNIKINSTAVIGNLMYTDFSDVILAGFTVTVTRDSPKSATIVIKRIFSAGLNIVDIDPITAGTSTASNPLQYNFLLFKKWNKL